MFILSRTLVFTLLFLIPFTSLLCYGEIPSPGTQIYANALHSVVKLRIVGTLYSDEQELSLGTGFIISADGLAITCSHVIPDPDLYKAVRMTAVFFNGDEKDFVLESRDQKADLALIRVKPLPNVQPLPMGDSEAIQTGAPLYVLGYPLNYSSLNIQDGILSTKTTSDEVWLTNASLNPGNSGGPAFSSEGAVVAIAVGGVPKARIHQGGLKYKEVNVQGINRLIPVKVVKEGIASSLTLMAGSLVKRSQAELEQFTPPAEIQKSFPVDALYDHHKLFEESIGSYSIEFAAEPGFKILHHEILKNSANGVGNERTIISPDRKVGTYTFTLRSGPMYDQYRGWLDATIQTKQVYCGSTC